MSSLNVGFCPAFRCGCECLIPGLVNTLLHLGSSPVILKVQEPNESIDCHLVAQVLCCPPVKIGQLRRDLEPDTTTTQPFTETSWPILHFTLMVMVVFPHRCFSLLLNVEVSLT